ncbi:TadG family pilus assembly protein [Brevundimonas sp.]|uniref:TadG family pilus assembly protein n=1 Tax=Brevundimonas sp. TaxID=1871086 RepID=UPI0037841B89
MPPLATFRTDRRGGVAIIAALGGGLACALAALTVDVGSLALHARNLQGAADLAALSAAMDIPRAEAAAQATATANTGGTVSVAVVRGRYTADRALAPAARFSAGDVDPNAVRVTLSQPSPLYFGRFVMGRDAVTLTRSATSARTEAPPRAMFSIGSRLAALNGGLANQLLGGLTGGSVSLSVMDYDALAKADVNLKTFGDAMVADLDLQAGDYDGLLQQTIDLGRALDVMRPLVGSQASSALSRLTTAGAGVEVKLGDLIGAEAGAEDGLAGALDASVNALDLVVAMAEIGGGDRQVALDLGAQAGLAELKVSLAIGERPNRSPWLTVTGKGSPIVRTAQARLYLKARTSQKLSGLAQVNLPILIELASSEARLDAIGCTPGRSVTLGVRPGIARASIGVIDETRLGDFKQTLAPARATLMSVLGLVSLTGSAEVEAADQGFTAVTFSDAQITAQTARTVKTTGAVNGIVVSLLQRLQVNVQVVGLGLGLGGIVQALGTLLAPLGPVLDAAVNPVLDLLGLSFGEADVTVHGAICPTAGARAALVG